MSYLTKYFLMANPSSPNKTTENLNCFVLYLLLGKDNIKETIHKDVNRNDKVFRIYRETNWLGCTISKRGLNV